MKKLRAGDVITWIDIRLIATVFWPLAEWIEYHFHLNQYRVAIYLLIASAFCNVFIFADGLKHGYFVLFVSGILMPACRYYDIKKLEKISAVYERSQLTPDQTFRPPKEWLHFLFPFMRMGNLVLYLIILPIDIWQAFTQFNNVFHAVAYLLNDQWILLVALGFYFAVCPPSLRGRKKKKVRDWTFGLMPKPVKS